MIVVKKFTVEMAHIVRNCSSRKCSHSFHGHSYTVEVGIHADGVDNAQMIVDFGLLKGAIKDFIESMDHTMMICKYDNPEIIDFYKKYNERLIIAPFNPTAEMLAVFIGMGVDYILGSTIFNNMEHPLFVDHVRVHETATGSAIYEGNKDNNLIWPHYQKFTDVEYSEGIRNEWGSDLKKIWENQRSFIRTLKVEQQINLGYINHLSDEN